MSVALHEIVAVGLTVRGMHPRPASAFSEAIVATPVKIALYRPGEPEPFAIVPAESYTAHSRSGEEPAELVLGATVPPDAPEEYETVTPTGMIPAAAIRRELREAVAEVHAEVELD